MNQRPVPSTLVNFRLPKALLEPFDHICLLSGKTRTQVLSGLIECHVSNVGSTMADAISQSKRINEAIRNSVLNSLHNDNCV